MTTSFRKTGAAACALIAPIALGLALPVAAHARDNAEKAEQALAKENADKAVSYAERAVVENPRDPQLRVLLGQAYLKAGRMVSARDSLSSAVELGDISPRTALMLALAQVGSGEQRLAIGTINMQGSAIPAADRGLALALAGETARGVEVLSSDIRAGNNTPKSRQNLAYALALDGRWREARTMAAQDVPAGEIGDRITQWASTARVDMYAQRIATLMGTEAVNDDSGMPTHLALSQSAPVMPATKPAPKMAQADEELPPVVKAAPASAPKPAPVKVAAAEPEPAPFVAPTPVAKPAPAPRAKPEPVIVATLPPEPIKPSPKPEAKPDAKTVSLAVVQPKASSVAEKPAPVAKPAPKPVVVAAAKPAPKPAAKPSLPTPAATGTHVAQLGSYASEDAAQAGWKVFQSRYANLRGAKPVITKATVEGKDYWRVAAGGFDSKSAYQMCSAVKASGNGCIPIAMSNGGTNGTAAPKQRLAKAD